MSCIYCLCMKSVVGNVLVETALWIQSKLLTEKQIIIIQEAYVHYTFSQNSLDYIISE